MKLKTLMAVLLVAAFPLVFAHAGEQVVCKRVIDGDTFVAEGVGRVRLMGVDTPELAREGKPAQRGALSAQKYLKGAIEGKYVTLEYDTPRKDKFGRTLAYVYTSDGLMVNEELLRLKLAQPIRYLQYSKKERFLKIAAEKK